MPLERAALKRATADARARAEAAAAGAGAIDRSRRCGSKNQSRGYPMPPHDGDDARGMAQDARAPTTPFVAGEIEIRSTVVLTATLK